MAWDSHIVVACVVERDGKFLLVEERIEGATVLNQPAGHWDPGETLFEAALRETLEESAWEVRLDALLGLYHYQPPQLDYGFLRVAFAATAIGMDTITMTTYGLAAVTLSHTLSDPRKKQVFDLGVCLILMGIAALIIWHAGMELLRL